MQVEAFAKHLDLLPSKEHQATRRTRPLTINIDLTPVQLGQSQAWMPKTPCSMLSPLTPRHFNRRLEWQNSIESTPKKSTPSKKEVEDLHKDQLHPLLVIEFTSLLGRRISRNLETLVKNHQVPINKDYDQLCNHDSSPDEDSRKLRAVNGRMAPAYRKRQCHRYLKHRYFFSSSDRRERKRVLLSGGLNKASRSLLKKMKKCSVVINKINDDTKEDEVNHQDTDLIIVQMDHAYIQIDVEGDEDSLSISENQCIKENITSDAESPPHIMTEVKTKSRYPPKQRKIPESPLAHFKCLSPVIRVQRLYSRQSSHRKSVRRRKEPRRLIDII